VQPGRWYIARGVGEEWKMRVRRSELVVLLAVIGVSVVVGYAYLSTRSGGPESPEPGPAPPAAEQPAEPDVGTESQQEESIPIHPKRDSPVIEVSETEIDFGKVNYDEKREHEVRISNVGTSVLEIRNVQTTCSCVKAVLPGSREIMPGESDTMQIRFDPQHFGGNSPRINVYIYTNVAKSPRTQLQVQADILPEYVVEPTNIDFGRVEKGKTPSRTFVLRQSSDMPVEILSLEVPDQLAAYYSERSVAIDGVERREYEVEVRVRPEAAPGLFPPRTVVKLRTNVARLRQAVVMVTGEIIGGVKVVPEVLTFGPLAKDETDLGSIDLLSEADFEVKDVSCDVPGVDHALREIEPSRKYSIRLTLRPNAVPGEKHGKVVATISAADRTEKVTCEVFGSVRNLAEEPS